MTDKKETPLSKQRVRNAKPVTPKAFLDIIKRIESGNSLHKALKKEGYTLHGWYSYVRSATNAYAELLTQAYLDKADNVSERILDTVDETYKDTVTPMAGKAMIDGLKFVASKLKPAKYGDRVDHHVNHTIDIGSNILQARERILQSKPTMTNVTSIPIGGLKVLEGGGDPNKKE